MQTLIVLKVLANFSNGQSVLPMILFCIYKLKSYYMSQLSNEYIQYLAIESTSALNLKHTTKVNQSLWEKEYSSLSEFPPLFWLVPQTQLRPRFLPSVLSYSSNLFYVKVPTSIKPRAPRRLTTCVYCPQSPLKQPLRVKILGWWAGWLAGWLAHCLTIHLIDMQPESW